MEDNWVSDLLLAISVSEEVLERTESDDPMRTNYLSASVSTLTRHFNRTKDDEVLELAIHRAREALACFSGEENMRWAKVQNISVLLGERLDLAVNRNHLDQALALAEEAVVEIPEDHATHPRLLSTLGHLQYMRYERDGNEEDLSNSISSGLDAVIAADQIAPRSVHDRTVMINRVCNSLQARYLLHRERNDLEQLISLSEETISIGDRLSILNDLIAWHIMRYNHRGRDIDLGEPMDFGNMKDLNEAIAVCRDMLKEMSEEGEDQAIVLTNLGTCLRMRYERLGGANDLEEGISRCREAVDKTPHWRWEKKYVRTTNMGELTPLDHPDRFMFLNNLGVWLGWKYEQTEHPQELDESIALVTEALKLAPTEHVIRKACLNNLCGYLEWRHRLTDSMADLEKSITYGREAVKDTPRNHSQKTLALRNLFEALKTMFAKTFEFAIRDEAIATLKEAIAVESTPPTHRLNALEDWSDLSEVAEKATKLLSLASPRALLQADQQYLLRRYAGLASTAAAAALQAGRSKEHAIGLLEHGRGVITSLLLQNRRDISIFTELRDMLDPPSLIPSVGTGRPQKELTMSVSTSEERYQVFEEFNQVLDQIRDKEGFKTFLLGPETSELMSAATSGESIVVINVCNIRCDAFLITSHSVEIVKLAGMKQQDIETAVRRFRYGKSRETAFEVLEWLWEPISLILEALGGAIKERRGKNYAEWPRVYWVPTGPLRLFPIHAVGYHNDKSHRSVMDCVISSYGLSVEEILYGRQLKEKIQKASHPDHSKDDDSKFILVSMETTPGNAHLPFVPEEIQAIREMLPPSMPLVSFDSPSHHELLSALQKCVIFHFAGHGMTNQLDPSLSGLLLNSDDDASRAMPLTVRQLQALRLQESRPPLLAYLSACSTGRIDDDRLTDEGIHLMGACRLAGFRHVIGSLWEVSDKLCVSVATSVYETILGAGLDDTSIAQSLHRAIRLLRDELHHGDIWVERNGVRKLRKTKAGPPLWAAFIHMGV
ncbi:CHAT domain-containing protein [Aspergillus foveolatus]|uniref:CHAT domain-containing protein n=1 Tax=Aspergillus foveolatus TaxID=210207 RepID=UPI003CCE3BC1